MISTSTLNKLLQKEVTKRYPPSPNTTTLANSFADFFTEKIDTIHSTLDEKLVNVGPTDLISPRRRSEFCEFAMVSQDQMYSKVSG